MNQKAVIIPFEGGYAKLLFNMIDGQWVCKMSDDLMGDLQAYLNGEEPKERVQPYIDLGGFDQ